MEGTMEKICPNCGEKLPDDSVFCIKCGTKIDGDKPCIQQAAKAPNSSHRNKKIIILVLVIVIAIMLVLWIVNFVQALNLKKELMRDWYNVEGEEGSYILCVLDFSDNEIEYRVETSFAWMDTTIATYDYKVVSGNKIKVLRYGDDWETITVEFSDDKRAMTVSPALTSVDKIEVWFNVD